MNIICYFLKTSALTGENISDAINGLLDAIITLPKKKEKVNICIPPVPMPLPSREDINC